MRQKYLSVSILFSEMFAMILYIISNLWDKNILLIRCAVYIALICNVVYAMSDLKDRFLFLAFQITIFVLLLGRTTFYPFSESYNYNWGMERFSEEIIFETMQMIYISLLFLLLGHVYKSLQKRKVILKRGKQGTKNIKYKNDTCKMKVSLWLYYITMVFYYVRIFEVAKYVVTNSYIDYYASYSTSLPIIIIKLGQMCPVAFCAYLATFPTKKKAMKHFITYLIMGGATLLTGQRSEFVLSLLLIVIYFFIRNVTDEEKWISKKEIIIGIIGIPTLMIGMVAALRFRGNDTFTIENVMQTVVDFFMQQGVSIKVLSCTIRYQEELVPWSFYSLSEITDFLKGNFLTQMIHPFTVYTSNTVENALYSNHLSHFISYKALGNAYLQGRGLGSSYIAELYADGGYFVIALGSIFLGMMLKKLPQQLKNREAFIKNTIVLLMIKELLYAPRSSFSAFLMAGINYVALITIILIVLISFIISQKYVGIQIEERYKEG